MAERAHVTSIEAIESFRAHLIHYVSKAHAAVEEVSAEVVRTRLWLQNTQRIHWEAQVRQRSKKLERAQAELSSARMSAMPGDQSMKVNAVRAAKRALEDAEDKLKLLKQWNREIDHRLDPLNRQLEKLHTVLAYDMPRATAFLSRCLDALAAYAELGSPSGSAPPGPSGSPARESSPAPEAETGPRASASEPEPDVGKSGSAEGSP